MSFNRDDWVALGASPHCASAYAIEEGTGATTEQFCTGTGAPLPGIINVTNWNTVGNLTFARCELNTPTRTLRVPQMSLYRVPKPDDADYGYPNLGVFGNGANPGMGILVACQTGELGADGSEQYLNIEVGDAATQKFGVVHIDNGEGAGAAGDLYFTSFPGVLTGAIDTGINCKIGRKYFIQVYFGHCKEKGALPDTDVEQYCQWYVRQFNGISDTGEWSGSGYITHSASQVADDYGHFPAFVSTERWYNTNLAPPAISSIEQSIAAYVTMWVPPGQPPRQFMESARYLGGRWPLGNMEVWPGWGSDISSRHTRARREGIRR